MSSKFFGNKTVKQTQTKKDLNRSIKIRIVVIKPP